MKMKMREQYQHPASFRDPSGFIFRVDSTYYRQVNRLYSENYDRLMQSGLYRDLAEKKLLIPHTELDENMMQSADWYKTLLPRQIPVISYPAEWCPAQLRDAALLTLDILELSLDRGMVLKDANPRNVQFLDGAAIFMDSLSFEKYDASLPWIAYRQFCECFLFPLYLHRYLGTGIHKIMGSYPEGIPAAVTAGLSPWKSRFNAGAWMHVFLQSRIQREVGRGGKDGPADAAGNRRIPFSKGKLLNLIRNLRHIVKGLNLQAVGVSTWSNYYNETILSSAYLEEKERLFVEYISEIDFGSALDLGANEGHFSRLLANRMPASPVIAIDFDWLCIQGLYDECQTRKVSNIIPLCVDISDPTPASGFQNQERASFSDRAHCHLVVALALVHHLVLGKNIPLSSVARYFAELTNEWLIVEFVPLSDEKAQQLIRNKSVWHEPYDSAAFENAFGEYFSIGHRAAIPGTDRVLYRMKKNRNG
jgi:hypothetical protein